MGEGLTLQESTVFFEPFSCIRLEKWKGIIKISGNTRLGFELEVATISRLL
jgi:hypothetical protein